MLETCGVNVLRPETHDGKVSGAVMAKKQPPWGALIGWVSRYEKLLMSGAGLKLIVRCLSYQGNIIADLLCASRIIKGREGYQ